MKKSILFLGVLFFLLMTMPSYAQKTSEKQKESKTKTEKVLKKKGQKNKRFKRVSETRNSALPTISSPTNKSRVPTPLVIKGTASKDGQIEVNVEATFTGGSQDLGTFKAKANSSGEWNTTPINLWVPADVKNVKFQISAIQTVNNKKSESKVVTVLPPQKVKTIARTKINGEMKVQLNPSVVLTKAKGTYEKKAKKTEVKYEKKSKRAIGINEKKVIKAPIKLELAKTFDFESFVDREDRRRLKTIGRGFSGGDNSTITTTPEEGEDDEFCTKTVLDTDINTTDFKDFTTNGPPDWLKPGIIMDALSFVRGENKIEERYNRGPITITNRTLRLVETVENPKNKSSITSALANLVSTNREELHPANIQYTYSEVYSKDELNLKINGRYSNDFFGVSTQLGLTSNSEKEHHYYLVEFKQLLFSLEVDGLDKNDIFPDNRDVDLSQYVYLSKVNYGRKGYFMFITDTSLEDLNVNSEASSSFMGHNTAVKANFEQIATSRNAELRAFYYGGTIESAIRDINTDMEAKDFKPLGEYMEGYHFSEAEAYPISYELKNLDNQRVGMNSKNHQAIGTCVPVRDIKLKVTLLGIECQTTADRGDTEDGDYGITQHVRYRANGDWKAPIRTQINKFGSRTPCSPGQQDNWAHSYALMCGNIDNQIHDEMSSVITKQRTDNINNYMVFKITPEEANDTNAEFVLNTWVKEYSTDWKGSRDDIVLNHDPRLKKVAIHDVLSILLQKSTDGYSISPFEDGTVGDEQVFMNFDGVSLPLRNINSESSNGKIILEGPIRARNPGPDSNEKAFVWMRFELID